VGVAQDLLAVGEGALEQQDGLGQPPGIPVGRRQTIVVPAIVTGVLDRSVAIDEGDGMAFLRVFISSTFADLRQDRAAARQVIESLSAGGREVTFVGMEDFGSYSASPLVVSRDFARVADIIVLLVGASYGSKPELGEHSFTEEEYEVMRRERIPCLAYLKDVDGSDLEAESFRRRVEADLVVTHYRDLAELRSLLEKHLLREVDAQYPEGPGTVVTSPSPPHSGTFVGRNAELATLRAALDQGAARTGVWGRSGIGKTRLVVQALAEERPDLVIPIWVRVDDVFGRTANGERIPNGRRMYLDDVIKQLHAIASDAPRGTFVFDNVQAAPPETAQLAARLGDARAIFLSWDLATLPDVDAVVQLQGLDRDESRALLQSFLLPAQRLDTTGVEALLELLDDEPLMLTLAGRRLRRPGLTPRELARELEGRRSELEGPALDKPHVTVHDVIGGSFLSLEPRHREVLRFVAAGPVAGLSREAYDWASRRTAPELPPDTGRAVDLDLVQQAPRPDWRGRRIRLRSVVREVLRATPTFADAVATFEDYLRSAHALQDTSIDVLELAIAKQVEEGLWDAWDDEVIFRLIATQRQAQRLSLCALVKRIAETDPLRERLATIVARVRSAWPPLSEEVIADLIDLLPAMGTPGQELLRQLWQSPPAADGSWLHMRIVETPYGKQDGHGSAAPKTIAALARASARVEGLTLGEFLSQQIRSATPSDRQAGMSAAHATGEDGAVDALVEQLDSSDANLRMSVLAYLEYTTPDDALRDRVYTIARSDEVESVRNQSATLLGVWRDTRARALLLDMINHPDAEIVARALSAIEFVADDLVAERIAALRNHPDREVRLLAVVALEFCGSHHLIDSAAALIDSPIVYERSVGIGMLIGLHPDDIPRKLLLRQEDDPEIHLSMLQGRLTLGDTEAMHEVLDMLHGWDTIPDGLRTGAAGCLLYMAFTVAADVPAASITALLDHDDAWIRGATAALAGQQRGRSFVAQLKSLEDDESQTGLGLTVGQLARMALDRIAGRRRPIVPAWPARLRTSGIDGMKPSHEGFF
jgi:HEAT repeat protein